MTVNFFTLNKHFILTSGKVVLTILMLAGTKLNKIDSFILILDSVIDACNFFILFCIKKYSVNSKDDILSLNFFKLNSVCETEFLFSK